MHAPWSCCWIGASGLQGSPIRAPSPSSRGHSSSLRQTHTETCAMVRVFMTMQTEALQSQSGQDPEDATIRQTLSGSFFKVRSTVKDPALLPNSTGPTVAVSFSILISALVMSALAPSR